MKNNKHDVFFLGTNYINFHSNKLISRIKEEIDNIQFYNTEMPDTTNDKDLKLFFVNLNMEIEMLRPKVILILGEIAIERIWKNKGFERDLDENLRFYYKEHNGIYYIPIKNPLKFNIFSEEVQEEHIRDLVLFISNLLEREV